MSLALNTPDATLYESAVSLPSPATSNSVTIDVASGAVTTGGTGIVLLIVVVRGQIGVPAATIAGEDTNGDPLTVLVDGDNGADISGQRWLVHLFAVPAASWVGASFTASHASRFGIRVAVTPVFISDATSFGFDIPSAVIGNKGLVNQIPSTPPVGPYPSLPLPAPYSTELLYPDGPQSLILVVTLSGSDLTIVDGDAFAIKFSRNLGGGADADNADVFTQLGGVPAWLAVSWIAATVDPVNLPWFDPIFVSGDESFVLTMTHAANGESGGTGGAVSGWVRGHAWG